jgi:hypothetical protein
LTAGRIQFRIKVRGETVMDDLLQKMPEALGNHLKSLMKVCGFDTDHGARKKFDKIVDHQGFHAMARIEPGFKEGIVILTYSGSLLTLSPENEDGTREIVYNSIDMRKDVVQKTTENRAQVEFPLELHKPLLANEGKIKKTSPVLGMAVEDNPDLLREGAGKKLRTIGERISRTLILVNQELFSRHSVQSDLEERDDLFDKWVILAWFRIGGWEEAVFYERARMLWFELFSKTYNDLSSAIREKALRDERFTRLVNGEFPDYIDVYKWIESEKINMDLGLMKALEQIPGRKDYGEFLAEKVTGAS